MNSLTGLPQGGVIILATVVFAAFAWTAGMPRSPEQKCEDIRIVEYLPIPAIEPVMKTPPLGWPVMERRRADDAPAAEQAVAKDDTEEPPRRHHRRHWRHR